MIVQYIKVLNYNYIKLYKSVKLDQIGLERSASWTGMGDWASVLVW